MRGQEGEQKRGNERRARGKSGMEEMRGKSEETRNNYRSEEMRKAHIVYEAQETSGVEMSVGSGK